MPKQYDIGFEEALSATLDCLSVLAPVGLPIDKACGFVAAEDCIATVDCPSASTSLKDGYAVVSEDVVGVSKERPARLEMAGMAGAGDNSELLVKSGVTVKVTTGAKIPLGADAVISEEFTREDKGWVICHRGPAPGQNILPCGSDVAKRKKIVAQGQVLSPAVTGLLAAGGIHTVQVYPKPKIGIISTGNEVVAPGLPLKTGQLYASNMVTLVSWLKCFQMGAATALVPDRREIIYETMEGVMDKCDVLLTSGGAWKSERDLTTRILMEMGGELVFHRVRMVPGKAIALIMLAGKPVFCLPGEPTANEMAFLQIALPGLLHMTGRLPVPFGFKKACLSESLRGDPARTQFLQAKLEKQGGQWLASPLKMKSRLQCQAAAEALIKIPEGTEYPIKGIEVPVQVLSIS
ncbi:MAG: molybdopterin molybdotransferase MoeA [Desulfobacterales bacterium]|nr:molybdopterin molybdotransferase MoeA [Desulfobacterales bacterium]